MGMTSFPYIFRIIRCALMPRIVVKFHQRKSTAVGNLGGYHQSKTFKGHLMIQMNDALNILHRIPIAQSITKTGVLERGCS
ncbi:hypothetical protein D3C75_522230 [compost metagenome]